MDIKIYDKLARRYDLATKIVSFGIEEIWRKVFIRTIRKFIKNSVMIDLASATGEMAKVGFDKIYFVEPSREMIKVMIEKFKSKGFKEEKFEVQFQERPYFKLKKENKEYIIISSTAEEFAINEKADLITAFMAFRNFDDIKRASENIDKHLKNGGYLAIVEMVKNDSLFSKLILWYMNNIVPLIAGVLVGMKEEYKLLGRSIDSLNEEKILENFKDYDILVNKKLFFPIAKMYIMRKNERENIKS
ncbi:class I SAM-dependent methyltransferase [Caminibacter mediatlanticus]|uniref:Ubiquinone/menaquinone biosynthesis methyltransferase n=1 Tax=Caminibacter mediatlanticus TB-2 TaxID=391592 RepID=A0AAI9AJH3_9BACT|nr:class I SAM-dependent methyltransferase [Caminibacter mediatlanticus]EDM24609.1 ubiquinone/menaquinone biosynthesis methyltransferase [Caminibacter mediatlanticus TB-2]